MLGICGDFVMCFARNMSEVSAAIKEVKVSCTCNPTSLSLHFHFCTLTTLLFVTEIFLAALMSASHIDTIDWFGQVTVTKTRSFIYLSAYDGGPFRSHQGIGSSIFGTVSCNTCMCATVNLTDESIHRFEECY